MASTLITLANLKKYMTIPFEQKEQDALLNLYISAICARIENHCKRVFASAAYDLAVDGDGSYVMDNLEYPISAFTELKIDGSVIDTSYYKVYANEGRIKSQLPFTEGDQNVNLKYTGGYSTIPAEIEMIAFQWISYEYERNGAQAVTSKSSEGYSVTFSSEAIPERFKLALEPFCRPEKVKQSGTTFIHTV
jgi:hypothetical protein